MNVPGEASADTKRTWRWPGSNTGGSLIRSPCWGDAVGRGVGAGRGAVGVGPTGVSVGAGVLVGLIGVGSVAGVGFSVGLGAGSGVATMVAVGVRVGDGRRDRRFIGKWRRWGIRCGLVGPTYSGC